MEIKEYLNNYYNISKSMENQILKKDIFKLKEEINKNIMKLKTEVHNIDVENDKLQEKINPTMRPEDCPFITETLLEIHSNDKLKSEVKDNLTCEILKLWMIVKEMKKQNFPSLMKDLIIIKNNFEKIEPELREIMRNGQPWISFDHINLAYPILIDFEELYKTFKLKKNYKKQKSKKIVWGI